MHNSNQLNQEKSPYLKQHAANPVWWHAWNSEAFHQAAAQNKLIFLSIGYSTCHWCHVMEKECFEQQEVADALNKNFISIKVDREERPDVDAIYMEAIQAMTGSGGWPLNVILSPDQKIIFTGTYIPKHQLLNILRQLSAAWQATPGQVIEFANKIDAALNEHKHQAHGLEFTDAVFSKFFNIFQAGFDEEQGGKKGKPKFIPSYDLRVLLRYHRRSGNIKALAMVQKTLDKVSQGGIYDQLVGGFHRYSTDAKWLVPHFEKMLYDQAALVNTYLEAYEVTNNPEYKAVVQQTLDYVLTNLTSPEGSFYSAEDADSEGVEGKFCVWSEAEIKNNLTAEEFVEFTAVYPISSNGNFEGENILTLNPKASLANRSPVLTASLNKLKKIREKRIRPSLDNKILASWNGLMISAMAKAARILNEKKYEQGAVKAADFIMSHMKDPSGNLYHRWVDHEAKFDPFDEDYAFLIDAFIELSNLTGDKKWLTEAIRLQQDQDKLFWDNSEGGYFLTTGKDKFIAKRQKCFFDNVTPSGNSMSVLNLLRLADLTQDIKYQQKAVLTLKAFPKGITEHPHAFSQMLLALDYALDESQEIDCTDQVCKLKPSNKLKAY